MSEKAQELNDKGADIAETGDIAGALKYFEMAIEADPQDISSRVNRATALAHLGRGDEAVKEFQRVAEIAPDNHYIWYNFGTLLIHMNRLEEADECFAKALSIPGIDKRHASFCYNNRAGCLIMLGKLEEAMNCLEKAVQELPENAEAWGNLAIVYSKQGNREKARECHEKAISHGISEDSLVVAGD